MIEIITEILRYLLLILFGVFVAASFLGIQKNVKNMMILLIFAALNFTLQGLLFFTKDTTFISSIYPLLTHLPLLLLFLFCFKKRILPSVLSITTTYLCCQLSNWIAAIPLSFGTPTWVVNVTYALSLIILFLLIIRYVSTSIANLLTKPNRELMPFFIIPFFYYVFDYIATVYSDLLYAGNHITVEFIPFLMCICYIVFNIIYIKQYEDKQELENRNQLMRMQHEQSKKRIETVERSEQKMSLLRHDMRHFLTVISAYIEKGENENAQKYIYSIIESVDKTVSKQYCSNDTVNMILSSFEDTITENGIDFRYTIRITEKLPFSDVDITSILSNALENSIHAVLPLKANNRIIELSITEKNSKWLILLSNTYYKKPRLADGMPIADKEGHGFGTQSIRYIAEKLNGNCRFLVKEDKFVLQIII